MMIGKLFGCAKLHGKGICLGEKLSGYWPEYTANCDYYLKSDREVGEIDFK